MQNLLGISHYCWLLSLALALLSLVRCLKLTSLLKTEYQMYIDGLGMRGLIELRKSFGLKEVRHLMMKLIAAKLISYALLLATVILITISYL